MNKKKIPLGSKEKQKVKPGWTVLEDEGEMIHVGTSNLKPIQPGHSGNPLGRPPDIVRAIALRLGQLKAGKILSEDELKKLERLGLKDADITVIESIILDWATSRNPIKQQMYIERIAGKVPNVNINAEVSAALVTKFRSKFTDAELERIAAGEDALELLLDKLPDVDNVIEIDDES